MSAAPHPPVFVVGCPRSGTTLLHHYLLSSGGFVTFRGESHVYDLFAPKYGGLRREPDRRRFMEAWLGTRHVALAGVDGEALRGEVVRDCRSGGDFLRLLMERMARAQGADRWVDSTPAHVRHLDQIRAEIPEARVIHVVRDGRDVALSLERCGWVPVVPGDHRGARLVCGLYWEHLVNAGREAGRRMGGDYLEVRFEDLVEYPGITLARVGAFIDHPLDYQRIRAAAVGSVRRPNSSFLSSTGDERSHPVGRWRTLLSPLEVAELDALLGRTLAAFDYPPGTTARASAAPRLRLRRALYRGLFASKVFLKTRTPLYRWRGGLEALVR